MREWFEQLFCKHEWEHKRRVEMYAILSGDNFDVICKKCGKIKGSYFKKYNENGTGYI